MVAENDQVVLRAMNAQMRRIDLLCKLLGPLFIGLIDGISTELAIGINLAMNVVSVAIEYFAIAGVYYEVQQLQQPKIAQQEERVEAGPSLEHESRLTHHWKHVQTVQPRCPFPRPGPASPSAPVESR